MLLHLCSEAGPPGARARQLSAPILIEGSWQAAELVRRCLVVALLEVVEEPRVHVGVIFPAQLHSWEQLAACPHRYHSECLPYGKNDSEEVDAEEEDALPRVLDVN